MTTAHVPFGTDTIIIDPAPPVVVPPIVVPPPPVITPVPSGPIDISTSGVTVSDKWISGPKGDGTGTAIYAHGTASKHIGNVTIQRCIIDGFRQSVMAEYVDGLTLIDCTIHDVFYAGVLLMGVTGGSVARNLIQRVGPQVFGPIGTVNAYHIAFTDYNHGTGDGVSSNVTVDANTCEDGPLWMGINAHLGHDLTISNNVVRRTRRPFFFASLYSDARRLTNLKVINNRAEALAAGTLDPTAFFVSNTLNSAVTGNFIDPSYPVNPDGGEWLNYVRDYLNQSTGLVRSGNTRA